MLQLHIMPYLYQEDTNKKMMENVEISILFNNVEIDSDNLELLQPFNNTRYFMWKDKFQDLESGLLIDLYPEDINKINELEIIYKIKGRNTTTKHLMSITLEENEHTNEKDYVYSIDYPETIDNNHFYMKNKIIASFSSFTENLFNSDYRTNLSLNFDSEEEIMFIEEDINLKPRKLEDTSTYHYLLNEDTPVHNLKHAKNFTNFKEEHVKNSIIATKEDIKEFLEGMYISYNEDPKFNIEDNSIGIQKICNIWNKKFPDQEDINKAYFFEILVRVEDDENYINGYCETPPMKIENLMPYEKNASLVLNDFVKILFYSSEAYQTIEYNERFKSYDLEYALVNRTGFYSTGGLIKEVYDKKEIKDRYYKTREEALENGQEFMESYFCLNALHNFSTSFPIALESLKNELE